MTKKILLYGGAFNPPHAGHMETAECGLSFMQDTDDFNELWFLPCYSDAFGKKSMVSFEHRVRMLELMLLPYSADKYKICTHEFDMGNKAGTYAVVKSIINTYPNYHFSFLIGEDQANSMRSWRNSRNLIKTIQFVTMPRFYKDTLSWDQWYRKPPHCYVRNNITRITMTSTSLRNYIALKWLQFTRIGHVGLNTAVSKYIVMNKLYMEV